MQYSIAEINADTDFTFSEVSTGETDQWSRMSLNFLGAAGVFVPNGQAVQSTVDCSKVTNGVITSVKYYYNIQHSFSLDDFKCTAIHEFLHGIGIAHNDDLNSVMRVEYPSFTHVQRCHGTSPTLTLSIGDKAAVNALY